MRITVVQLILIQLQLDQCVIPATDTGRPSVDIGVNANLELVDKFCYFGDMLSLDGYADAAVENRIRIGWNKFRQLIPQGETLQEVEGSKRCT